MSTGIKILRKGRNKALLKYNQERHPGGVFLAFWNHFTSLVELITPMSKPSEKAIF